MPVNLAGQLELTVETPGGEQALQEGVEQTLVELVVHPAAIDGLGHQGLERGPGNLVWRDVLSPLREERQVTAGAEAAASRAPPTARPEDPPPRSCAAAPHAGFPPRIRKVTIRIGLRLAATNLAPFYVLRRRPSPVVHCCPLICAALLPSAPRGTRARLE